jgi:hypothetical protein
MIARMVQDCLAEDFDHAAHHRDKLQKELAELAVPPEIWGSTDSKKQ